MNTELCSRDFTYERKNTIEGGGIKCKHYDNCKNVIYLGLIDSHYKDKYICKICSKTMMKIAYL